MRGYDKLEALRRQEEIAFARAHKNDSDDELLAYVRNQGKRLGRIPLKREVIGFAYLKTRLGPWPRVLERAGLKEVSARRKAVTEKGGGEQKARL